MRNSIILSILLLACSAPRISTDDLKRNQGICELVHLPHTRIVRAKVQGWSDARDIELTNGLLQVTPLELSVIETLQDPGDSAKVPFFEIGAISSDGVGVSGDFVQAKDSPALFFLRNVEGWTLLKSQGLFASDRDGNLRNRYGYSRSPLTPTDLRRALDSTDVRSCEADRIGWTPEVVPAPPGSPALSGK